MANSAGFSLLELMIVLGLSSLVLLASQEFFTHAQQRYLAQQAVLRAQENTQLALQILHNALQTAGEAGCLSSAQLPFTSQVRHLPIQLTLLPVTGFFGHEGRWQPPLPYYLAHRPAINTDVVLIEHAGYARAHLTKAMTTVQDPIHIPEQLFAAGDIVLIADCHRADLFKISAVQNEAKGQVLQHLSPENHSAALSHVYAVDAQVMHWQIEAYYLAQSTRQAGLALYRQSILPDSPPIELVAGIEKWAVNYVVLQNNQAQRVNAASIQDWQHVKAVGLEILAFAPQASLTRPSYFWQGLAVTPSAPGHYAPGQLAVPLYNASLQ